MMDGTVSFGWFVRNRYYPLREGSWKPETAKTKRYQIQRDLVQKFEHVALERLDRFTLQTHINHLASCLSKDRVLQARSYLKSIFSEAVEQDFLVKDPTRKLAAPSNLRQKDKTVLTWEQLRLVLASVSERDRILLSLDMTGALRPSELFGLRWRSLSGDKLTITETVYKGKIRTWGKTSKSLGDVHLPKGLADDLEHWRQCCPDPSPDAFIFTNSEGGPLDTGNVTESDFKTARGETWLTQAELPGTAPHDRDTGAEAGIGKGHSSSPAALEGRYDCQRIHDGVARVGAKDGRFGLRKPENGASNG